MREALLALGRHGDRVGASLALEIGFDPGDKVRGYLDSFDLGSLGVNFGVPTSMPLKANSFQVAENFSKIAGRHTLKFGADARYFTSISEKARKLWSAKQPWMARIARRSSCSPRKWWNNR